MSRKYHMVSATDLISFISDCGVGQGDTQGPPAFLGVIDFLLTMLNLAKSHDFLIRDDNQRLSAQPAMIFADDSNTISSTLVQHQKQADIICMFSLITGLRIAPVFLSGMDIGQHSNHGTNTDSTGLTMEPDRYNNPLRPNPETQTPHGAMPRILYQYRQHHCRPRTATGT
jgi:hypothetical protein